MKRKMEAKKTESRIWAKITSLLLAAVMLVSMPEIAGLSQYMTVKAAEADSMPEDAVYWNGNYYYAFNLNGYTWSEAKEYCESLGGHLATITSQEENELAFSLLSDEEEFYWLGGRRFESDYEQWEWITGEDFSYANWANNQPDNGYSGGEAYIGITSKDMSYADAGKWNDFSNNGSAASLDEAGFICEWDNNIPIKELTFTLQETASDTLDADSIALTGTLALPDGETATSDQWEEIVGRIQWEVSDTSVVDGLTCKARQKIAEEYGDTRFTVSLIPKSEGTATVTGTIDGMTASCEVTVRAGESHVTAFTMEDYRNGAAGRTITMAGGLWLEDGLADPEAVFSKEIERISWTSSDPAVAEVTGCTGDLYEDGVESDLYISVELCGNGTATLTGTIGEQTASCVVTVRDFDEAIVRASYIYDTNYTYIVNPGTGLEYYVTTDTPSCILNAAGKENYLDIWTQAWDALQDTWGAIDDPSGLLDKPLEKTELYEGIIFSVLEASSGNSKLQGKDIIKDANSFVKAVKEDMKAIYGIEVGKDYKISAMTQKQQERLRELSMSYFDSNKAVKAANVLKNISKAVDYMDDLADYANYQSSCIAVIEMCEAYKAVLQDMYEACSWENMDLKLALADCVSTMQMSEEDLANKMGLCGIGYAGKEIVKAGIDEVWKGVKESVAASNPYVALLWAAYYSGNFLSNTAFNTDEIVEKTVKMAAMADVRKLTQAAYQKEKAAFAGDETRENAEKYLAAIDVLFSYFDDDCDAALAFVESVSGSFTGKVQAAFGASSTGEVKGQIESIQESYRSAYGGLNTVWVNSLEEDYPEQYENYLYLLDPDTDAIEAKYNVACPVDVYVYDTSGELAASIVGGSTWCREDDALTVVVSGDEKELWFYGDQEAYAIRYIGTGSGTMDITVEEYDEDGNVTRTVKHLDVPLEEGTVYTSTKDASSADQSCELNEEGGKTLMPTADSADESIPRYTLTVQNGYLLDGAKIGFTGSFCAGEKVTVYAVVPDSATWTGWTSDAPDGAIADADAAATVFTMPSQDAELMASYQITGNDNNNTEDGNNTGNDNTEDDNNTDNDKKDTEKDGSEADGNRDSENNNSGGNTGGSAIGGSVGEKTGSAATVAAKSQTIKVKASTKTFKVRKLKKRKQTFTVKVTGAKTALKAVGANAKSRRALKIKVKNRKTIKVTVKKGAKKGTYKIKVYAKSTSKYKASGTKTLTIKVK